jgi:hypothetical protein
MVATPSMCQNSGAYDPVVTGGPWILAPEPRPTSDVPYHHDRAPGQKYLLVDAERLPGSPVYVALRRVDGVPPDQPRWLDPHCHSCNSFYVFVGDGPDLGGLHAVVALGEGAYAVESPAAALVPPRLRHTYWLTEGSGWYLQITLSPTYEGSLLPQEDATADGDVEPPRAAVGDGPRRRFVDDELFRQPGVVVEVDELAAGATIEPCPLPAERALSVAVVLGRANARARVRVGGAREVVAPATAVTTASAPSVTAVDDALIVWISPRAELSGRPDRSRDRAAGP